MLWSNHVDGPIQRIVLLAYGGFADYLRTLPLHESQREIEGDDESTLFEYHLKPTFDFYQLVLAQGDQVEVLEPESVRNEMRNFAKTCWTITLGKRRINHARNKFHSHRL